MAVDDQQDEELGGLRLKRGRDDRHFAFDGSDLAQTLETTQAGRRRKPDDPGQFLTGAVAVDPHGIEDAAVEFVEGRLGHGVRPIRLFR